MNPIPGTGPRAASPGPGPSGSAAIMAQALALTPAEKLNLILHQTLLVLSFLRRNAKFNGTPMPHLCPSPYASANAHIVATLDSSSAIAAGHSSPSAAAAGQDGAGSSSMSTTGTTGTTGAQYINANGSRERDEYLDRCARLFAWAGQPPAVRVSTPISHSPSMDEEALLSAAAAGGAAAATAGGNAHLSIHVETAAKNGSSQLDDDDDQDSIDATSLIQSVAQPAAAAESAPLIASAAAAAGAANQQDPLLPSSAATTVPPSPEPGQSSAKKPTPQPAQTQSHHISLPATVLIQGFEELLKRLTSLPTPAHLPSRISPLFLVTPFLRVLQSGDATGPITSAVVTALHQLIAHDAIAGGRDLALAVSSLVSTVYQAKFESTDAASDDLVLYRILDLALALVHSARLSQVLSDEAVCQMFELGLSMWMMADASELVRQHALRLLEALMNLAFTPPSSSSIDVSDAPVSAAAAEILRVLGTILAGDPAPSSESSLVLAHHLIQLLVSLPSLPADIHSFIVQAYLLPCLITLDIHRTVPAHDARFGVGITAPTSHHALARPSTNVLVMTWTTMLKIWTRMWRDLDGVYELIVEQLLRPLAGTAASASPGSGMAVGGGGLASKPAPRALSGATATDQGIVTDEPWDVRQARLLMLRQVTTSPSLLLTLWTSWDCHPDRPNLLHRIVSYHCQLLDATSIPGLPAFALDFLQYYLTWLHGMPHVADSALRARKVRKAQVRAAVDLFRTSPKQAVEYLTKNALVPLTRGEDKERDAQMLAGFLFDAPGIDKSLVGEYISKPAHALLLTAYMSKFDFVGLRMDQALRAMMQRFRLPGESQMIDRILDTFAKHFFSQNPNQTEIANMDAGFILAFSMIMLNTDQHNPQVRNRMDVDSFCRNLRGLNNKQDFRRGFLEEVFKEIHEREITDVVTVEDRFAKAVAAAEAEAEAAAGGAEEGGVAVRMDAADTEAMLKDVFGGILEGLLACAEPRVLSCLSLLAQMHECSEALLAKLAVMSSLTPIQSASAAAVAAGSGGGSSSGRPSSSLGNLSSGGAASPSSSSSGPARPPKPKLNHTHLVLFFSTLYHQRGTLTPAAKEYAMHALANLFIHDLLPDSLMHYFDPLRGRSIRIPILVAGAAVSDADSALGTASSSTASSAVAGVTDGSRSTSPTGSMSTSSNAPRAGSSLFSFFSYISTTFAAPPTLNEEDLLVKDMLAQCQLDAVILATASVESMIVLARTHPDLAGLFTTFMLSVIDAHPEQVPEVKDDIRTHLGSLLALAPQLAVAAAVRIAAHCSDVLAQDPSFASRVVGAVPNLPDMLANLSSAAAATGPSALPALALVPFLTPAQFIDAFRKSKSAAHAAQLLHASSTHVVAQLSDHDMKDVIMVIYRLLIRADSKDAVTALASAALSPAMYARALACGQGQAQGSGFVEYLKLFAVVALHPSVPDARSLKYVDLALFGAYPAGQPGVVVVLGLVRDMLVPLVLQYRVLVTEADKMKDQVVGKEVKQKCFADQARAAALVVKYFLRRVGEMEKIEMVEYVWEVVSGAVGGLVVGGAVNEVLVETAVPTLENAVRVLHSLGLMTDPKTGKPSQLWKITKSKLGKVLPGLEESLFPSMGASAVAEAPRSASPRPQSPPAPAPAAAAPPVQMQPTSRPSSPPAQVSRPLPPAVPTPPPVQHQPQPPPVAAPSAAPAPATQVQPMGAVSDAYGSSDVLDI